MSSGLFYFGTNVEVELGDVVRIRRLLRRPLNGIVCYLAGISPKHPQMDIWGCERWAIESENKSVYAWIYILNNPKCQPSKRIEFVCRGESKGRTPDIELK